MKRRKLCGSTMIEPVIAGVIICIAVSTFSLSLGNVTSMGNVMIKADLHSKMSELMDHSLIKGNFIDEEIAYNNHIIIKSVLNFGNTRGAYVIKYSALDNEGNLVDELSRVINDIDSYVE